MVDKDGHAVSGWQKLEDGKWYHFSESDYHLIEGPCDTNPELEEETPDSTSVSDISSASSFTENDLDSTVESSSSGIDEDDFSENEDNSKTIRHLGSSDGNPTRKNDTISHPQAFASRKPRGRPYQ